MILRCESLEPPMSQLVKAGKPHCEHILSALPPLATEERTFVIGRMADSDPTRTLATGKSRTAARR